MSLYTRYHIVERALGLAAECAREQRFLEYNYFPSPGDHAHILYYAHIYNYEREVCISTSEGLRVKFGLKMTAKRMFIFAL